MGWHTGTIRFGGAVVGGCLIEYLGNITTGLYLDCDAAGDTLYVVTLGLDVVSYDVSNLGAGPTTLHSGLPLTGNNLSGFAYDKDLDVVHWTEYEFGSVDEVFLFEDGVETANIPMSSFGSYATPGWTPGQMVLIFGSDPALGGGRDARCLFAHWDTGGVVTEISTAGTFANPSDDSFVFITPVATPSGGAFFYHSETIMGVITDELWHVSAGGVFTELIDGGVGYGGDQEGHVNTAGDFRFVQNFSSYPWPTKIVDGTTFAITDDTCNPALSETDAEVTLVAQLADFSASIVAVGTLGGWELYRITA